MPLCTIPVDPLQLVEESAHSSIAVLDHYLERKMGDRCESPLSPLPLSEGGVSSSLAESMVSPGQDLELLSPMSQSTALESQEGDQTHNSATTKSPSKAKRSGKKKRKVNTWRVRGEAISEAALVGQQTRLREHVVESTSLDLEATDDAFYVKSGVAARTQRSNMFRCIVEAAAMGTIRQSRSRQRPVEIVTNNSTKMGDHSGHDHDNEGDYEQGGPYPLHLFVLDKHSRKSTNEPEELVNVYVHNQQVERRAMVEDPEDALEQMEHHQRLGEDFRKREVQLPTMIVPRFQRPLCYLAFDRVRASTVQSAADEGIERFARLEDTRTLIVHNKCGCVYCKNPTPFQTQSYQKLRICQGWSDDSLETEAMMDAAHATGGRDGDTHRSQGKGKLKKLPKPNTLAYMDFVNAKSSKILLSPQRNRQTRGGLSKDGFFHKDANGNGVKLRSVSSQPQKSLSTGVIPISSALSPSTEATRTLSWNSPMSPPERAQSFETSPPPLWSAARLKPAGSPRTTSTNAKLEESKSQASNPYAEARQLLRPRSGGKSSSKQPLDMIMTEHSPLRQYRPSPQQRLRNTLRFISEGEESGKRLSASDHAFQGLDGEVDEEALLRQELNALSLEVSLPIHAQNGEKGHDENTSNIIEDASSAGSADEDSDQDDEFAL